MGFTRQLLACVLPSFSVCFPATWGFSNLGVQQNPGGFMDPDDQLPPGVPGSTGLELACGACTGHHPGRSPGWCQGHSLRTTDSTHSVFSLGECRGGQKPSGQTSSRSLTAACSFRSQRQSRGRWRQVAQKHVCNSETWLPERSELPGYHLCPNHEALPALCSLLGHGKGAGSQGGNIRDIWEPAVQHLLIPALPARGGSQRPL